MRGDDPTSAENSLGARLSVWVATGLGIGLASPAPGTIGGLWGLLLVPPSAIFPSLLGQVLMILLLFFVAVAVCDAAARTLAQGHDPNVIVFDEIVALPIVFLGMSASLDWKTLAAGYLAFRACDVWKPGLARAAEKLPGGWGIVADDAVAAMLAWFVLRGLLWADRAADLGWLIAGA
jgi:phosphatidylglycerophosphatase A